MEIRKAAESDINAVEIIYQNVHAAEAKGITHTGWQKDVYPLRTTAEAALRRSDLYVMTDGGDTVATAIINRIQVDVYEGAAWKYAACDGEVLVLHTLAVDPMFAGKGYGTAFVAYYEEMAKALGCKVLRMDTNAINFPARRLYAKLGYREADVVPCVFNGIEGVKLVLLEKKVGALTDDELANVTGGSALRPR